MKFFSLRTVTAIVLTALLTACGAGQQDAAMPTQLAASTVISAPVTTPVSAVPATGAAAVAATVPNMPAPDCAAEGCNSLRIIDGNAEAFRIDAMRRAAAGDSTQS
ncbi:hypothetical protein LQ564_21615 [Massilia sp. G4R7]|uniref:Uncharacterized protein n=1 Tax=Massilia phyllostachyos TaxID=2898585 RepID=A0ABS8QAX8_9BURK|nr:hypothetical protein [Massilia phyllostachyos]MCD2518901.1 hypothetical protein [Massilia phyllostachyos]